MDMPSVTGLDILKYIKENNIDIMTIVLTGVEDIDLAISAMKLGTSDYMLKPIVEDKLLQALDRAIHKSGMLKEREKAGSGFFRINRLPKNLLKFVWVKVKVQLTLG